MSEKWYYHDGNSHVGPFTIEKLNEFLAKDVLNGDTLVWKEGTESWITLSDALEPETPINTPQFPELPRSAEIEPMPSVEDDVPVNPTKPAPPDERWLATPVTPWRRLAARSLDTLVNGATFFLLFGVMMGLLAPDEADRLFSIFDGAGGRILDAMITTFVACLLSGLFTGMTGFSLGKLIFGVKVLNLDGRLLGISAGISRDLTVWVKGLGLGIGIISLITMIVGHRTLALKGVSSWDDGRHIVLHRRTGWLQYVLNVVGVLLWLLTFALFTALEKIS